jgi:hypothetical protein
MSTISSVIASLRRFILPVLTLLALFIVVYFRFSVLMEKTREGTTIGRLYDLRQAILLYYQDHQGVFPRDLNPNSPFGRYMETMPAVPKLHPKSGVVSPQGDDVVYGNTTPGGYGKGWYYNYENGRIFVNSIGLDTRGNSYSTY